jgi:hypothetical protein
MRRIIGQWRRGVGLALAVLGLTVGFGAGVAGAGSPHFISADIDIASNGNLECSFKEAGLANDTVDIACAAPTADATYFCINRGGNHPSATNKETVSGAVGVTQTFAPSRNGQTTGTVSVPPPGPGGFTCPGNQTLTLVEVTYHNATLTDVTNNVLGATETSLSSGCLLTGKLAALCP